MKKMQCSVEDVFAAGDVTGGWLLAHVAYREAEVAAKKRNGTQ